MRTALKPDTANAHVPGKPVMVGFGSTNPGLTSIFVKQGLRNPAAGVVEPDDLDHALVLEIARPYLGEVVGVYGDWTPLHGRGWPFGEEVDGDDPWQSRNVRVT